MTNKKYKMESFVRYFYGINPRVENEKHINEKQFIRAFDNFNNEYNTLSDLNIEIKRLTDDINKRRH